MMRLHRFLATLSQPHRLVSAIWRRTGIGSFGLRLRYDAIERPPYAYGVYFAALQAKKLHVPRISVVEFGVAGGNGLLVLERHAKAVERELGVGIEVYGFDTGAGLPPALDDYRDTPHFFKAGMYRMDWEALKKRLTRAQLVIGNVADTARPFFEKCQPAPIGFVAFDMDLYSSTRDAFQLFGCSDERLMPRVICYFDDLVWDGSDLLFMSPYVGELLAVNEFNEENSDQKISPIYAFEKQRVFPCPWSSQMFAFHRFHHPLYNVFLRQENLNDHLALRVRAR
jgi:hypothetical protein